MSKLGQLVVGNRVYQIIDLPGVAGSDLTHLPYIHRILLENVLRTAGDDAERAASAILAWLKECHSEEEIPVRPGRILMHDTTCGPALVDIAALRSAIAEAGGDPSKLNPVLPVDVSTDHSIAVDAFGRPGALAYNSEIEFRRNAERYRFMKWASKALTGFRTHPPGTGIMHTLNLERLASVVATTRDDSVEWAMPDTLIGTDSHTPMINGIGVLGWGVGGLEAESVMFGMPVMMRVPDVTGVRLTGRLRQGLLATDLALTITERLRQVHLSDHFVEFFGDGVTTLSAGDRAVVANMAPEFGANSGYFPIDHSTTTYLRATARQSAHIELVEAYARRQGLWFDPRGTPRYTNTVEVDLSSIETSVAGPRRPQDRISAGATVKAMARLRKSAPRAIGAPPDRAVAIAAITSCTNTTDPRLLVAAGLLARKARTFGLKPPPWVKTSLAPGSPTADQFLRRANLLDDLEAMGFGIVGYGCTTCIGNSGPLTSEIERAIEDPGITPVAVLSGNRNFPGRVHPQLEAGFLASPPLVVAFAIAGDVDRNILADPLGISKEGLPIRLADVWPSSSEIDTALAAALAGLDLPEAYAQAEVSTRWQQLDSLAEAVFPWDQSSTYIRRPPFAGPGAGTRLGGYEARPLLVLGDDVTTDHISPAGAIPSKSDAAEYLVAHGESRNDLNVFASRRGNWQVMVRGLFTNGSVRNLLAPDIRPGATIHAASGEELSLWLAADRYAKEGTAVVILAGERYGMGSSRDWAAKGVALLGVRAVLALGFERIHRSNLIGMGVLPLRLPPEARPDRLRLAPEDTIEINASADRIRPRNQVAVRIRRKAGEEISVNADIAVETSLEVDMLRAGGILPLIFQRALTTDA
jgi:aconitate hydratase